jgi:hypothetical protein
MVVHTENSDPHVMVLRPSENWKRFDIADSLRSPEVRRLTDEYTRECLRVGRRLGSYEVIETLGENCSEYERFRPRCPLAHLQIHRQLARSPRGSGSAESRRQLLIVSYGRAAAVPVPA